MLNLLLLILCLPFSWSDNGTNGVFSVCEDCPRPTQKQIVEPREIPRELLTPSQLGYANYKDALDGGSIRFDVDLEVPAGVTVLFLQMQRGGSPVEPVTQKRHAGEYFEYMGTLAEDLIQQEGGLTRPLDQSRNEDEDVLDDRAYWAEYSVRALQYDLHGAKPRIFHDENQLQYGPYCALNFGFSQDRKSDLTIEAGTTIFFEAPSVPAEYSWGNGGFSGKEHGSLQSVDDGAVHSFYCYNRLYSFPENNHVSLAQVMSMFRGRITAQPADILKSHTIVYSTGENSVGLFTTNPFRLQELD